MKNVLIITYNFPPRPAVGGLRLYGLAKYLPIFGWSPIILTAILPGNPNPELTVIQTGYDDVVSQWKKRFRLNQSKSLVEQFNVPIKKESFNLFEYIALISSELLAYPDGKRGWYDYALLEGEKIFQDNKIEVIISSSSPVTSHLIAKKFAEKYHIPWIADLRDLWTQNHNYQYSFIRKFFEKRLEIRTLTSADALVTVSNPWREELAKLHQGKKIFTVRNGYNPDEINPGMPLEKKFNILYIGTLYRGYQDPEPLLIAINELISSGKIDPELISIDFFIDNSGWLNDDIKNNNLDRIVRIYKTIPRNQIIERQRKSQLLLLLTWNDPNQKGVIPAKVFEYLAAKRPIISIGKYNSGELREILETTHAGIEVTDIEEIKKVLMSAYNEFLQKGYVQYHGIPSEIQNYSQKEMTKKFVDILNKIT